MFSLDVTLVRFLHVARLVTVVIAVSYTLSSLPTEWHQWLEDRLNDRSVIYETGYSTLIAAGEIAAFIAAVAAVLVVFFAIPRFTWGGSALSWCFLAMGLCLLTRVKMGYWDRHLSAIIQIIGYSEPFYSALPPLVIGAFLRYSFIKEGLYRDPTKTSNQSDGANSERVRSRSSCSR